MEIKLMEELKTVMSAPYGKHGYFAWPTVTRLKNGRIAVGASGFRLEHICPFGKAVLSFSDDECESFSLPAPVIDTPLDDRDCGLCAFGESSFMVTSFNNTRAFQRQCAPGNSYIQSYLDTVTDEEEKRFLGSTFRISRDNGISFGEVFRSPVTSPHGPVELSDGTVLWTGRVFSSELAHEPGKEGIEAHKINPDGTTEYVGRIENITLNGETPLMCEPHAVELDNGDLICHIRAESYGENKIFTVCQSVSHDMGRTWSVPEPLLEATGGAPAHLIKHPSGRLISVYGYRNPPYGIKAMVSDDGGKTWETGLDINVNGIDEDIGYPATVVLNDGSMFTVFYAHPEEDSPAVILGQKWTFG